MAGRRIQDFTSGSFCRGGLGGWGRCAGIERRLSEPSSAVNDSTASSSTTQASHRAIGTSRAEMAPHWRCLGRS